MLAGGLLQTSPAQRPLKGVSAWGGKLGLPNTRFFRRNWPREGQVIFFLTHQYLTLMKSCRAELVFPRCIFPLLAAASPRVLGCHSPEQTHCLEGASAAHCSARLAQRMVCTMKSPLNHCSSPVPGLLFPTQEKQQLQEARNRKEVLSTSEPWPWGRRLPGWEWDCQGAQGKGR